MRNSTASRRLPLRIRPTSDRVWWIVAVGYMAVFGVLYIPNLESPPLERCLNALLLGAPAALLALKLRFSPHGARVTLYAGFLALTFALLLDVAAAIPAFADIPMVRAGEESCRSVGAAAFNLGFFLILVSCLQLLELSRREQAELIRSREEARRSSLRHRELFAGMRDAVFESEATGQFISCNPAGVALLGYECEQEILRIDIPTELYVDAADRDRLRALAERDGFVKDFQVRLRRKDRSIIHALVNSTATRDEAGRLWGFRGTIRDVTSEHLAREEIARLTELNRNIIESLSHGLLVVDAELRTVRCNRGLERITRVPRDRLLGREPWIGLPGIGGLEGRLRRALAGETVSRDQVPLIRDDGRAGYVADAYAPLRNAEGEIVGVIGFVEEITKRMELEQQLIQAEKVAAIGQMVSGIAHEINNPLTSVSGYAQLLLASDCDAAVKQDVARIAEAAERCGQIVRGLLTYSRKHEHRMTAVDPIEVLERTFELRAYELTVEDIELERNYEMGLPFVRGDTYQLQQVILNLLQNAVDSIHDTDGGGVIRLSAATEGDQVVMGVYNSGEPIPEAVARRVFDPFFTTKEVGRGTGLGLSVAQNIVRNHGGRLTVRNEAGGVRFEVRIPASLSEAGLTPDVDAETTTEVEVHLDCARILVVDDEEAIQELFVSALPDAEVVGARDGRTAMLRLEAEHWDAVISDLRMPGGVSGVDLVEWARQNRPTLVPRMVIMTGAPIEGEVDRNLPSGLPLLLKPFGLGDLRASVAEAVGQTALESAAS